MNGHCKHCEKPLRWARTCYGRPIPLDPEPDASGDVIFRNNGKVVAWLAWGMEGLTRYRMHRCDPQIHPQPVE